MPLSTQFTALITAGVAVLTYITSQTVLALTPTETVIAMALTVGLTHYLAANET
jgi:hypothetical protein